MKNSSTTSSISPPPSVYRICVRGTLNAQWSECLEGMSISSNTRGEDGTVTTLYGQVTDQAALLGILNCLYDLHYAILLVERVQQDEQTGQGAYDETTLV